MAESAHIGDEIRTGMYRGLPQNASAIDATFLVQEQLNNLERNLLRGELRRESIISVDEALKRRDMDKPGIREAISISWSSSTKGEQAYAEIIDSSSPGCRRSDFTDEKSMQLYCSFFDQETPLSRLQMTYMLGKNLPREPLPSRRSISEVDRRKELAEIRPDDDHGPSLIAKAAKLGIPVTSWKDKSHQQSPSLFSYESRQCVPSGFEQVNEDLFARKDNRFMVFNGAGVDTWKMKPQPTTKVHGIEEDIAVLMGSNS